MTESARLFWSPMRYGTRDRFAIEIGAVRPERDLRQVDLWAASVWLSCDDNTVFVPQFAEAIESTLRWLLTGPELTAPYPHCTLAQTHRRFLGERDEVSKKHRVLDWGPTTDNVAAFLFRPQAHLLQLSISFWRNEHPFPEQLGHVFTVELPERELLLMLHDAATALRRGLL